MIIPYSSGRGTVQMIYIPTTTITRTTYEPQQSSGDSESNAGTYVVGGIILVFLVVVAIWGIKIVKGMK